ncbi:sugar ABC transporter ATP-binding protein [Mesorhizobium sp. B3-1-6]|uniref:sugar ABC transporter ATP-binding protein n=1 Tax=Mesorhizobium sp. B3-1-6 TaxID=2589895 RepID=UPI00112812FD|nr:sugar ABC transporter ATP-binding protein [Mesorhizobium sp. B3-1-6]TPI41349.1 sugar ABC transporter ATP-binding protein [Mesorhizobium sp. B3-1-6]
MNAPQLSVDGVGKSYPGVRALNDVSLSIGSNEIVGLIGENGSGKSTLLKIMGGLIRPDQGRVLVRGQPLANFGAAAKAGIGMVFQEQSLLPNVTVAENILLGCEGDCVRLGLYDWRRLNERARRHLAKFGSDIAPDMLAGSLSFAQRQLVEMAKALAVEDQIDSNPIVLLDEPTSVLDAGDIDKVLGQILRLRERASAVFVSHRLDEVLHVCDRIYVMSNGRCVAERTASATPAELQGLMLGHSLAQEYSRSQSSCTFDKISLSVRNLSNERTYSNVSFDLHAGEILGIAGVEGSGRESICRTIYGAEAPSSGQILLDGRNIRPRGPREGVRLGIAYIPSERRVEGIVSEMTVRENMTLAHLGDLQSGIFLDFRRERRLVSHWVEQLRIKTPSMDASIGHLSGGNQQKVVLAKWLIAERPRILILDHPLRGLDVGAKAEIFRRVRELAQSGIAVLIIADTLEELIAFSDTILVMRDGAITARFAAAEHVPEPIDIIRHMI